MIFVQGIILFVGIIAIVYTRSLFYALEDELEDDALDCFITSFLLIAGYGLLYVIYWAMRSVLPNIVTPILYLGIYFMFLFLAYYIRSLVAIQNEWQDGKVHFQHKEIVERKRERRKERKDRKGRKKKNVSGRKEV